MAISENPEPTPCPKPRSAGPSRQDLLREMEELRARLEEAEETIHAIQTGGVDGLIVSGPEGDRVFALEGVDYAYRVLVDVMTEGVLTLDPDGTILSCNNRFAKLVRMPVEEVLGRNIKQLVVRGALRSLSAFLGDPSIDGGVMNTNLVQAEGTTIPVKLSAGAYEVAGLPALCLIVTDMTSFYSMAKAQLWLASIVNGSHDAVISKTLDNTILSWNGGAERMFGYCAQEAVGRSISIILPPDRANEFDQIDGTTGLERFIDGFETVRLTKSGHSIHVSLTVSPTRDMQGNITGASIIARDISERKKIEAELDEHRRHLEETVSERTRELSERSGELETAYKALQAANHNLEFMNAELQESEDRFRSVLDNSMDCIYRFNLQTECYEYISPSAAKVVGYSPDELATQDLCTALAMIHPDDLPAMQSALLHLEETGEAKAEYRQRAKSGEYRWISNHISLTRDDDGRPLYRDGIIRDITERRLVEEALRESEERYRVLFEAANDGVVLHPLGSSREDSRFVQFNNVIANLLGYDAEEMARLSPLDIQETPDLDQVPEETRQMQSNRKLLFEKTLIGKDGRRFPAEISSTVFDLQGKTMVLSIIRDITERRRADEALKRSHEVLERRVQERTQELADALAKLRESAARLDEAQRMACVGNWDCDIPTNTGHWSDETFRLLGLEPQSVELTHDLFLQRVHPDDRQQLAEGIKLAMERRESDELTFRIILPNGQLRHMSAHGEVVLDDRGEIVQTKGTLMDITEQVQAREEAELRNQQLYQADKMVSLGILTSGVAHEINNPNHAIMTNTALFSEAWTAIHPILEREYEESGDYVVAGFDYSTGREQFPKMLQDIADASRRIEAIVAELRDYAQSSPEDSRTPIDIQPVIESACHLLTSMIKKSTDHFVLSRDGDLPRISANRQRIEQVLINLIQNACQALPDRDKGISISTRYCPEKYAVVIVVKDEGTGIEEHDLTRLGNPFFTTKRGHGGTGLGLWISFNIVREHGGTLEFHSVPGKGTRAELTLPISQGQ